MTEARLSPGHVVARRYVVQSLIGRGGMGEVYVALDNKLERKVALKVVAAAASPYAKRRLEAEAKAVASVDHPGIVTLHDVVEDGDALVLVMELVKGTSLRAALEGGALAPRTVAAVVRGVADALEAAHARGLVHRDVKPDNVLVRKDGRTALLDFGIAKAVAPPEQSPLALTVTGEGAVVGTPAYLAPEQARGEEVTPASDQFALAVTAYELLTRQLPWKATGVTAIVAAIVSSPPRPIEGFADGAGLDQVFARALAKSPEDRFAGVAAFASALDVALGGDGGALRASENATPDAPPTRVSASSSGGDSSPRRISNDRGVAGATRVFQAGDVGSLRSDERHPPAGRATWGRLGILALILATAFGVGWWVTRGQRAVSGVASSSSGDAKEQVGATFEALDAAGAASDQSRARFRDAARAYRRGEVSTARRALDELIASDPGFASAQILRAYLSFVLSDELDEPARAALRAATAHADVLGARDAEFLKALTPSFLDPPKWRDTAALLEAIVAKAPADVRALEALAFARVKLGDYPAAERVFRVELGVDPGAVLAHGLVGQIVFQKGDFDGSKRQLEACVREQPSTTYCRAALALHSNELGDCAEADRVARDALSLDPNARGAASARANATAGLGATTEVIAELLSEAYATLPPERLPAARAEDAALLAWRVGDFARALAALDAPALADGKLPAAQASRFAVIRVRTLWEMNERERAADAAEAYLSRAATLRLPERVWTDPTGRMLAYLRAAGRISAEEHRRRVDAWFASWRARRSGSEWTLETAPYIWPLAYGSPDWPSADEARLAIEAAKVAEFDARPRADGDAFDEVGGLAGALYAAAGREAEAEAFLVASTRACRVAPDQRAFLALGNLAARKGDKPRACAAYDEIEKAWRDAKPKSVTRELARAASSKLGCGNLR